MPVLLPADSSVGGQYAEVRTCSSRRPSSPAGATDASMSQVEGELALRVMFAMPQLCPCRKGWCSDTTLTHILHG